MKRTCLVGITGFSGAGKTTLIRTILPELKKRGLAVGVLKHVHHTLNIDRRGKDTEQFYQAGAEIVLAHDETQGFTRYRTAGRGLADQVGRFPATLDLIIVEGHKDTDIPGIWLGKGTAGRKTGEACCGRRMAVSRDDPAYEEKVLAWIRKELKSFHQQRPLMSGLLVGGKSLRMGTPKTLLQIQGATLAERSLAILSAVTGTVLLLGSGPLPEQLDTAERLPDVGGLEGPISGMLSAFRWAPESAWIISSVDMPLMHKAAWEWLLGQRRPGVWAVLPKIRGSRGVETTGAVYEPMIFEEVEALAREGTRKLQDLARHPKVKTPLIPESLCNAWINVNTSDEWKKVSALCRKGAYSESP